MVDVGWHEHLTDCYQCRAYGWGEAEARCEAGEAMYRTYRQIAEEARPRPVDPVLEGQAQILELLRTMDVRLRLIEEVVGIVLQQPLVRRALGPDRLEAIERVTWEATMEIGQKSQSE